MRHSFRLGLDAMVIIDDIQFIFRPGTGPLTNAVFIVGQTSVTSMNVLWIRNCRAYTASQ